MAKRKTNEVPVEETQVENVAVEESAAVITEVSEEKELSESEKIDAEINEASTEAEIDAEETAEISEKVEKETIEQIVSDSTDERKGNEKFFAFDKKEARRFFIDKDQHIFSVVFYKRLLIGIKASEISKIDDVSSYASMVSIKVIELIKSLRFDDVEYEKFDIDEYKLNEGYDIGIMSIDVPYTAKTSIFINKIRNLLIEQFAATYLRSSSNVKTSVDVSKINSPISGFTSFTSYERRDGTKKVTARAAAFINEGFTDSKSVDELNRYIISLNKINLINDNGVIHQNRDGSIDEERFMYYYQTFRSKVNGMIYNITKIDDGKITIDRLQYYIHIRVKKVCNTYVPYGIKIVTTNLGPIETKDLREIFSWNDQKAKTGFLGNEDLSKFEPNVSNLLDDIEQIQTNIVDSVESAGLED